MKNIYKVLILGSGLLSLSGLAEVNNKTNETISQCCSTCMTPQAIQCRSQEAQHRARSFPDGSEKGPAAKPNNAKKAASAQQ